MQREPAGYERLFAVNASGDHEAVFDVDDKPVYTKREP